MKYDDLTLMKFADGELDSALVKEIEIEVLNDDELKVRLEVFTSTSSKKIKHAQEYGSMQSDKSEEIPNHIIDLIDNFKPSLKQRMVALIYNVKTKYKALTAIMSSITAALIWLSLPPLIVTRSVDFLEGSSVWSSALKIILSYRGLFWN